MSLASAANEENSEGAHLEWRDRIPNPSWRWGSARCIMCWRATSVMGTWFRKERRKVLMFVESID